MFLTASKLRGENVVRRVKILFKVGPRRNKHALGFDLESSLDFFADLHGLGSQFASHD